MWRGMVRRKLRERKESYAVENPADTSEDDTRGKTRPHRREGARMGHPQKLPMAELLRGHTLVYFIYTKYLT